MLINFGFTAGDNNRPWLTAQASSQGEQPFSDAHRPEVATAAAAIAASASPSAVPVGLGNTGAGARSTNNAVNPTCHAGA